MDSPNVVVQQKKSCREILLIDDGAHPKRAALYVSSPAEGSTMLVRLQGTAMKISSTRFVQGHNNSITLCQDISGV
ncbi:hypothetical protein LSAT2_019776 [Lamellibrachia satsuma]|nr:hypothetical protein LSAT2_019776 [Lamellibrachia satsuma]